MWSGHGVMLPQRALASSQDEVAGALMNPARAGVDAESEDLRAALATSWRMTAFKRQASARRQARSGNMVRAAARLRGLHNA